MSSNENKQGFSILLPQQIISSLIQLGKNYQDA